MDPKGDVKGMVKVSDAATAPTDVVVPLDRVKVVAGEKRTVVAATRDELKAMPKPKDAPDTRAGGLSRLFGSFSPVEPGHAGAAIRARWRGDQGARVRIIIALIIERSADFRYTKNAPVV